MINVEIWIHRILFFMIFAICLFIYQTRPVSIKNTEIYYTTLDNGKVVDIEGPITGKSMGCNIYWRVKGYPCYKLNLGE